eukprot:TRINITY_DN93459_c0_g1_i1.p1 TRINITY_DN93459_c0_g1~~TRINITY_DN93459_c0_g1_i1.p1  ORF type:complete len:256 (+),score=52.57 TRINITY_DN93459_c0_g1_i1:107-769(+)
MASATMAKDGAMSGSKGKSGRIELQPPSHGWISWCILFAYLSVFIEGAMLMTSADFGSMESISRLGTAQFHLCSIYVLEVAIALGPGWCAMSPGWTSAELMAHHVPYTFVVMVCFALNQQRRWMLPLTVVLLTSLNEGLFIVNSLGSPGWVAKARRAFGFSIIVALITTEVITWWKMVRQHWADNSMFLLLLDQLVFPAIFYHFNLICMYIKRWKRTRSL